MTDKESSNKEKASKTIFTELSVDDFKELLYNNYNMIIIIKFGAKWCGPCKKIKDLCYQSFQQMPDNVICFDLDVDDNFELFATFKSKKMVKTIPTIFGFYYNPERYDWFIPELSISSSDEETVLKFFKQIYNKSKSK
uniref:Thioredoxin domain-containing protein n=1 Tax=viral metagenome TaxID=1070528 RepID=A0A6C0AXD2_9ZZZZ|tara:strand:+ start:1496 stop:1909 length:414 start_codon:yes stop_codon:yes gene_type:complete